MERLNPGGSLKDRPVLHMLLAALANGRLQPGKTILDSSSGNGVAEELLQLGQGHALLHRPGREGVA